MRISRLKEAVSEAYRFINTALVVIDCNANQKSDFCDYPSKNNSTCKRASMDLTRALSNLRKGDYHNVGK